MRTCSPGASTATPIGVHRGGLSAPAGGYTLGEHGDALNLYYGAADTCIALATGGLGVGLVGLHLYLR